MSGTVLSQISDLEASFQMPREVANEIEVRDGDKRVVYAARAHSLWLDGLSIRGGLSLTKYEAQRVSKRKRTGGWFSKKFEIIEMDMRQQIWHLEDDSEHRSRSRFLITSGKPARRKDCSADCSTALLGQAANAGILLSDKLLDLVLSPIYAELMKIYQTIQSFGGRQ